MEQPLLLREGILRAAACAVQWLHNACKQQRLTLVIPEVIRLGIDARLAPRPRFMILCRFTLQLRVSLARVDMAAAVNYCKLAVCN